VPSRLLALTFDAADPARLAGFWAAVLGREVIDDPRGSLLPGSDVQTGLRFVAGDAEKVGLNRVHLHLTSTSPADQQRVVAAALGRGASHLDVGQLPEDGHVVLADPAGNEFCVIEPGNSYLAGCGFLGELACEGTRKVGLFWAAALGWPLVWDEDEETAVQSPHGGTKVAWGGGPEAREEPAAVRPRSGRRRTGRRGRPVGRAGSDPARQRPGRRHRVGRSGRQRVPPHVDRAVDGVGSTHSATTTDG